MIYEKPVIDGLDHHFFTFDSLYEYKEEVRGAWKKMNYRQRDIIAGLSSSFVGRDFVNPTEAFNALDKTWEEGLKTYEQMLNELRSVELPMPQSIKRYRRWSEDQGDEIDLDRLRRGQSFWRESYRTHRPGPLSKTIVASIGATSSVKWNNILWRGAASTLLTELLEKAGYRVELWGARRGIESYRNTDWNAYAICYKRANEPLDISSMVNAISGWAYRTAGFTTNYLADVEPVQSFGTSTILGELVNLITPDEDVIVCEEIWNRDAAIRWVREQVSKIV